MTDKEKTHFYTRIGLNIKAAREQRGVKQHVLAEMLGLSRASVVNIEKGRQHVTMHTLWQISKLLKTDFLEFTARLDEGIDANVETQRMKFDDSITSQREKDEIRREIEKFFETLHKK